MQAMTGWRCACGGGWNRGRCETNSMTNTLKLAVLPVSTLAAAVAANAAEADPCVPVCHCRTHFFSSCLEGMKRRLGTGASRMGIFSCSRVK